MTHATPVQVSCPWCRTQLHNSDAYPGDGLYCCPYCTRCFALRRNRASRSDGTPKYIKVMALIVALVVIFPLMFWWIAG
jgi:hypothetical protein